jgi:hypothetical protein
MKNRMSRLIFITLLLSASVFVIACQQTAVSTPLPADQGRQVRTIEIHVDDSGSVEVEAMREFIGKVCPAQLQGIVTKHHLNRLEAFRFGVDGFNEHKVVSHSLPTLKSSVTGEAGRIFGGIDIAVERKNHAEYASRVEAALKAVDYSVLLPSGNVAACTDLNGVFKRFMVSGSLQTIAIIATDAAESCHRFGLGSFTSDSSGAAVVVVLMPEKGIRSSDQFDQRAAEITKAVPQAVVIPPFADLAAAIDQAVQKAAHAGPGKTAGQQERLDRSKQLSAQAVF